MKEAFPIVDTTNAQSIRELNIILSISQSIISTLDYEKVLQLISNGISELLEIESAAIYMLENEEEIVLAATTPPLDPNVPDSVRRALLKDHPNIQKAILGRKSILVTDTRTARLSPAEKSVIEMRQLRSLLYFPFIQEDKVLGILILGTCNKSRKFSRHEMEIGQMVANQLSVAIQNTRFHVDLKNYKDNLEKLVSERTHALKLANQELKSTNDELQEKNILVLHQKEELEATLNHLKSMQAKLVQAEKMASLGVLTAGVAHEINNPLNFIMGAYVGLRDFFDTTGSAFKSEVSVLLKGLNAGLERASKIVMGLNQFSRDNQAYDEDCDIHAIIDNCLIMLSGQYKDTIRINKSYLKERIILKGNVGKLHQVFTNLLTNSIQSIEDKGQISISTQKEMDTVLITMVDTGCGIDAENLPKVADPFFTTKEPRKGTGLGLFITYNIIQEHKGFIEFESNVNQGTKVSITLPIPNQK